MIPLRNVAMQLSSPSWLLAVLVLWYEQYFRISRVGVIARVVSSQIRRKWEVDL